jgi:hypothetical protein
MKKNAPHFLPSRRLLLAEQARQQFLTPEFEAVFHKLVDRLSFSESPVVGR